MRAPSTKKLSTDEKEFVARYLDREDLLTHELKMGTIQKLMKLGRPQLKLFSFGLLVMSVSVFCFLLEPRLLGWVVDQALLVGDQKKLLQFVWILLGLETIRFFATAGYTYLFSKMGQKIMQDLRVKLFTHYEELPLKIYDQVPTGKLITRLTNDVAALSDLFSAGFITVFANFCMMIGIFGALLSLDLKLGLIASSMFPVIFILTYKFSQSLLRSYQLSRSRLSAFNAFLAENILGMKVVQLFSREKRHLSKFSVINESYTEAQSETVKTFAYFQPLITWSAGIATALVMFFGGKAALTQEIPIGVLTAFFGYVLALFNPIREIADKWNIFLSGTTSADRIFHILEWKREKDLSSTKKKLSRNMVLSGKIEFKNVWFSYQPDVWVLKDFSFTIEPGQSVGVVGHTGAGKTSLISLLMRFYEFQKGEILIDGKDIRQMDSRELRTRIGLVQQDAFLFSGSVKENITLWRNEVLVEELMKQTKIDQSFPSFEKRLDVELEERGANLSLGEKQVIAFSRAASQSPDLWILDEATANIDSESESVLLDSLDRLSQSKTKIMIAHRLSTVKKCDQILVLHEGKLIEKGNHRELSERKGYYSKLLEYQKKGLSQTTSSIS